MIIGRRSFLTGLLAAPIIIRPGIIMPVRPLVERPQPIDMGLAVNLSRDLVYHFYGVDMYGQPMVETLRAGQHGRKLFKQITHIVT